MALMDTVKFGIHAVQSIIALVIIGCSAARVSEHTSNGYALAIFTVSLTAYYSYTPLNLLYQT